MDSDHQQKWLARQSAKRAKRVYHLRVVNDPFNFGRGNEVDADEVAPKVGQHIESMVGREPTQLVLLPQVCILDEKVENDGIGAEGPDQEGLVAETESDETLVAEQVVHSTWSRLRELQERCEETGPLVRYLRDGVLPDKNDKVCRRIVIESQFYFLDDEGVLWMYRKNNNKRTIVTQEMNEWRVIPKALRQEVLTSIHEFGHPGIGKTVSILDRCQYKWPGVYAEVKKHVLSCKRCSVGKRGLPKPTATIESLETPTRCG